ncbi:hypothetical protein PFLUV_G00092470 [Perca fluviatilis]|uniref:Uncharacterized protein n=1 Tax=Perca fluviatilis TaxID=8168 RepID=A0A6A5EH44_PERFL|nr:hypothetical protein PFLUV_G00092470 [Perca fluviatilis]
MSCCDRDLWPRAPSSLHGKCATALNFLQENMPLFPRPMSLTRMAASCSGCSLRNRLQPEMFRALERADTGEIELDMQQWLCLVVL